MSTIARRVPMVTEARWMSRDEGQRFVSFWTERPRWSHGHFAGRIPRVGDAGSDIAGVSACLMVNPPMEGDCRPIESIAFLRVIEPARRSRKERIPPDETKFLEVGGELGRAFERLLVTDLQDVPLGSIVEAGDRWSFIPVGVGLTAGQLQRIATIVERMNAGCRTGHRHCSV